LISFPSKTSSALLAADEKYFLSLPQNGLAFKDVDEIGLDFIHDNVQA
jgi:hypothetical protein